MPPAPEGPRGSRGRANAIRVEVTHVVSSDAWLARTTIRTMGLGVVATGSDDRPILVSVRELLQPDEAALCARAEREGGPSSTEAKVALASVHLAWEGSAAPFTIKTPRIAVGGDVAALVLPIDHPDLAAIGPVHPVDSVDLGEMRILTLYEDVDGDLWQVGRRADTASDPAGGFAGHQDLIALDAKVSADQLGAAITSADGVRLLGLASILPGGQSVIVRSRQITDLMASPEHPHDRLQLA